MMDTILVFQIYTSSWLWIWFDRRSPFGKVKGNRQLVIKTTPNMKLLNTLAINATGLIGKTHCLAHIHRVSDTSVLGPISETLPKVNADL